jgi:hypothetical protein
MTGRQSAVPGPLARRRRTRVVVTGSVIAMLLTGVLVKVTVTPVAQHLGERAWRDGDPVAAAGWFGLNDRLNLAERWIAPYNLGVAAHGQRAWMQAAAWFEEASTLAPTDQLCRVLLNQALSLEAAGDELRASGDTTGARARYGEAQAALSRSGGCEGAAAGGSDSSEGDSKDQQIEAAAERLEEKTTGRRGAGTPSAGEGEADDTRADRLAERNREAARRKQEAEDEDRTQEEPDEPGRTW